MWDTSTPLGTDFISLGDDNLRALKADIQTALRGDDTEGTEAVFPGGDAANPVFRYRGLKDTTANRPAAAHHGLFFDTTRNVLQRSNGSTWDDIATMIPSGTVSVFYQASAPVGWTAVAVNDKFLRVVTAGGTGGSTGGTVAASTSLAHTHSISSSGDHTHSTPSHQHLIDYVLTDEGTDSWERVSTKIHSTDSNGADIYAASEPGSSNVARRRFTNQTRDSGSGTSGSGGDHAHSGSTGSAFAGAFAYADVIICSKN